MVDTSNLDQLSNAVEELKTQLGTKEKEKSGLQGQLDALMRRLKTDFGVDTLEAALKLSDKLAAETKAIQTEIETEYSELVEITDGFN